MTEHPDYWNAAARRAELCRPLPNHSATSPEENPHDYPAPRASLRGEKLRSGVSSLSARTSQKEPK